MYIYDNVQIKLPNKFRADISLESSCDTLQLAESKRIAEIIDQNGNFVFSLDKKQVLRQLNLYVHSHDWEELEFVRREAQINRRIVPLAKKWFLNISMSQSFAIVKHCFAHLQAKRHLFALFLEFYEGRKTIKSPEDFQNLEALLNRFKDDVYDYKKNSGN